MEKFKNQTVFLIINKYFTIIITYGIISRWAGCTHQWFEQLWKAGLSSKTGVSLIPVTRITSDCEAKININWAKLVYGFQKLTDEKLQRLNEEHKSNYKYVFIVIIQYFKIKLSYSLKLNYYY